MKVQDLVSILTQVGVEPDSEVIFYLSEGPNCVIDLNIAEVAFDDEEKKTLIELHEVEYD